MMFVFYIDNMSSFEQNKLLSKISINKMEINIDVDNKILIECSNTFHGSSDELIKNLERLIENKRNEKTFLNSEASMFWIMKGCIKYFNELGSNFLGNSNVEGIPSSLADHFASNLYRLGNAMRSLGEFWKIPTSFSEEFKILLDIRTFIIHSGEGINKTESIQFEGYKDTQLGLITKVDGNPITNLRLLKNVQSDYIITLWSDKHDEKGRNINDLDYNIRNKNFIDTEVFISAYDVRNTVMVEIQKFLANDDTKQDKNNKTSKLPEIKKIVIDSLSNKIDFDKLAALISNSPRSTYIIENGLSHWGGYGLKRLLNYSQSQINNPFVADNSIYNFIIDRIQTVTSQFWDEYQDDSISDDKVVSLDIESVFGDLIPKYEKKTYLHSKLFSNIAPFFNSKEFDDATDVYYLVRLITEFSSSFDCNLKLENSVDDLICDYFCEAIKIGIKNREII